jgi:Carboxypeptidase regulatory-like domain/TonB-dependent Receptor Plug Domain
MFKKSGTFSFLFLTILTSAPTHLFAGKLFGIVTNAQTSKPIASVSVVVKQSEATIQAAETDSTGKFSMDTVPAGSYAVLFSKDSYEPQTIGDVYISGLAEKRLDVEMSPGVYKLDNMVVRASSFRKAPDMASSSKIISADELMRMPGALMDVQRVVQNLPSVASGGDQTNEIIVRGSTPGENLFIMDNIEIPNPNHFAQEGAGGGVISLVNPLLVKGLTFSAGAPPAQYGDKASSVLDVKMRDGSDAMALGGVDLGIAGAGIHCEGPTVSGGNFMASATKSFLDLVVNSKFNNTATAVPEYWGGQSRIAQTGPSYKLYADGIFGNNGITINNAQSTLGTKGQTIASGGTVYAGGMTIENIPTGAVSASITLSAVGNTFDRLEYTDTIASAISVRDSFYANTSSEQEQCLKAQCALKLGNNDRVTVGAFGKRCDFSIDRRSRPDTLDSMGSIVYAGSQQMPVVYNDFTNVRKVGYKYGAFVSGIVHAGERAKIVPGVRLDGFSINKSLVVSPRISGAYSLTGNLDVTGALGVQYQQPDYSALATNPACPPRRAITGIAGVEYYLSAFGVHTTCEGYYKRYDDLPVDSSLLHSAATETDRFTMYNGAAGIGRGKSYGAEAFAQKKLTDHLSWTTAYSLSRSQDRDPRPGHAGQWYDADFDFGQSLTLTAGWKQEFLKSPWYASLRDRLWFKILSPIMPVSDRMELSARFRYLGGRPYTQRVYDSTYARWYTPDNMALNTLRYPGYSTMDLRWERRFGFGFLQMIYYIDLQNIFNRKNVWQYMFVDGASAQSTIYQLPFFPAGGVIIGF